MYNHGPLNLHPSGSSGVTSLTHVTITEYYELLNNTLKVKKETISWQH